MTEDSGAGEAPIAQLEPRYTLRPMRASDLDRVLDLELELFGPGAWSYAMLAEELGGQGRTYYVVTARYLSDIGPEPVVGYGGFWFDGEVCQIMTVGVARKYQHHGAGTMLIDAMIARSRELGAQAVLLEVAVNNDAALSLYAKYGFARLGVRKRYYQPEDRDAYTMRLELTSPPS